VGGLEKAEGKDHKEIVLGVIKNTVQIVGKTKQY